MNEEKIARIVFKFEKIMGPVAKTLAMDLAKRKNLLKGERISPSDQREYTSFLTELTDEYSKITNRDLVERILEKLEEE